MRFEKSLRPWQDASNRCHDDYGGGLVQIETPDQQRSLNSYLKKKLEDAGEDFDFKGAWIGLTDLDSDPQNPYMHWEHGSRPSYENWEYGEPETGQNEYDGTSAACGAINNKPTDNTEAQGQWSAKNCVARKPEFEFGPLIFNKRYKYTVWPIHVQAGFNKISFRSNIPFECFNQGVNLLAQRCRFFLTWADLIYINIQLCVKASVMHEVYRKRLSGWVDFSSSERKG